ncbi:hypothetical protein BSKO_12740 [Bryopsis sp. KO-2023]|nr:hypothetical protein BSKO_12740 [Bryopsis sp. KO-2023]
MFCRKGVFSPSLRGVLAANSPEAGGGIKSVFDEAKRACASFVNQQFPLDLIVPEDKKLNAIWSSGYSCNPNTTAVDLPKEVGRFVIPPDAHQQFPWGAYMHNDKSGSASGTIQRLTDVSQVQRSKFNPMIPWVDARLEDLLDDPDLSQEKEKVAPPGSEVEEMKCVKRTYQPSVLIRKRRHGFLSRLRNRHGRKTLSRRRRKGRWRLSA